MKAWRKTSIAIMVVIQVVLLVVLVFAVIHRKSEYTKNGKNLGRDPRIDTLIVNLKKESLQDSINNLATNDQQFFFPGFKTSRKSAQIDLETLLSARRFIKTLQSIEKLPNNDGRAKSDEMFSKAFEAHTNAIYVILQHEDDPSSPKNDQSLLASREAICGAMFVTADLGQLDLLSAQMDRLEQFQNKILPILEARISTNPNGVAIMLLRYLAPDKRFEVNVLRVAVVRASNNDKLASFDALCNEYKMEQYRLPIISWDAHTTWFERFSKDAEVSDKIVFELTVYDWRIDDYSNKNLQNELVDKLRSVALH